MTRMTGPDCVVMCNLINTYIHTYIHTYNYAGEARDHLNRGSEGCWLVGRLSFFCVNLIDGSQQCSLLQVKR